MNTAAARLQLGTALPGPRRRDLPTRMLHLQIALLPAVAFAVLAYGLAAVATLMVAMLSCWLAGRIGRAPDDREDGTALPTGLLLGMSLPPALPLWMVAVGGFAAVWLGRRLLGGLGGQVFPPALVGRIVLQAAFPTAMASAWLDPFSGQALQLPASSLAWPLLSPGAGYDAISGATPLAAWRADATAAPLSDLWLGRVPGATGEASALLLLAGGLYLAALRVIDWRIPVAVLVSVAALSALLHALDPLRHAGPLVALGSGGLMLGAWFLASDPSSSPLRRSGAWIHGLLIGALVVLFRATGLQAEGVMYAILLACALVPQVDRLTDAWAASRRRR